MRLLMLKLFSSLIFALILSSCGGDNNRTDESRSHSQSPDDVSLKTISIPTGAGVFDGLAIGNSSATPVILLHGFPTTADQYINIMNELADAGYYAIAPNMRGFSAGARPVDSAEYHPELRTQDVIDIVNQLGIYRFHLVGHNAGALTAWILASMHPDRIVTLTAISVPHPLAIIDGVYDENAVQAARAGYADDFRQEGFEERFVANNHEYMRWLFEDTPQESIELYIEKLGTEQTVDAILNYYRERDWTWILTFGSASITVPTLQIWGDDDSYVSITSMEYSENYVDAEYDFEILEGVSHWVTETADDEVSSLLLDHFEGRY